MVSRFPDPNDRERHDLKVERRVMAAMIALLLTFTGAAVALVVRPDIVAAWLS